MPSARNNGSPTAPPLVQLRGIKNLADDKLIGCEPWTFEPRVPTEAKVTKEEFRLWQTRPSTDHLFYTATEPLCTSQRPSKLNPAAKLHGLIADFDAKITPGMMKGLLERCPESLQPAWVSRTFSGGARLVWLFQEPIAMDQPYLTEKFLAFAKRELRLTKLLPGLDEPAWKDLHRLYEVGSGWQSLSGQRISSTTLHYWLFESAKKANAAKLSDVQIPLEVVEQEVHRRFPNRWDGAFDVGSRGVVFLAQAPITPQQPLSRKEE